MKLDRKTTKLSRLNRDEDDGFVPGTMAERMLLVWPITKELASLSAKYDVERRLQRDVTVLKRRRG